jgi:hypothetical protein
MIFRLIDQEKPHHCGRPGWWAATDAAELA